MKSNYNSIIKETFDNLEQDYVFERIRIKIRQSDKKVHDLSIGDVTCPLGKSIVKSMEKASRDLKRTSTFKGYSPTLGYMSLRKAIAEYYLEKKIMISKDDIIVTSGAKEALFIISCIFSSKNVYLQKTSYPVYRELAILNGQKIHTFDCGNREESFEFEKNSLVFICSPNNPTGETVKKPTLENIVEKALVSNSFIIFDAAYESFIEKGTDEVIPKSIFEIEKAKECAMEIGSFSKSSGFTGVRCGWVAVLNGTVKSKLFRLLSTISNGVSYQSQMAALGALSLEGRKESEKNIEYYKENARIVRNAFSENSLDFTGGIHSPYIWLDLKDLMSGEEFCNYLFEKHRIALTPGEGFGKDERNKVRISCFCKRNDALFAARNIPKALSELKKS